MGEAVEGVEGDAIDEAGNEEAHEHWSAHVRESEFLVEIAVSTSLYSPGEGSE